MKKKSSILVIMALTVIFVVGCSKITNGNVNNSTLENTAHIEENDNMGNDINDEIPINQEVNSGSISGSMIVPDILGEVLEVSEDGLRVLVDSNTEYVKGQIWITITEETNFFEDGEALQEEFFTDVSRDFKVGNKVSMVSSGEIAESYPMQGVAVAVYSNEEKAE
ncbi:DUF3221 domain-containing protein [Clostridium sp. DL1XJH146]